MSYKHKGWVIDGLTDWLVHAFGKGVSKHPFSVNNNWAKPNIKPLHLLSSFPRVVCREPQEDMTLLCILWRVLAVVIVPPSYPSFLPFPTDQSFPWDTWGNQEALIGAPFACLICPFLFVNSDTSHTLTCSPNHLLSLPPLINTLPSFPLQSLLLITNSSALFSLSFSLPWISLSHYLVISHVLLFKNAQEPSSNLWLMPHWRDLPPFPKSMHLQLLKNQGISRKLVNTAWFWKGTSWKFCVQHKYYMKSTPFIAVCHDERKKPTICESKIQLKLKWK